MRKRGITPAMTFVALIITGMMFMGCIGNEAKPKPKKTVTIEEGTVSPQSGWFQNADPDTSDSISFNITVNGTALVYLKIEIEIQDWDSAHSDTDEGSDPDKIIVEVASEDGTYTFRETLTTDENTGIANVTVEFPEGGGQSEEDMPTSWIITLTEDEFGGGKPATLIPRPGIIPGPFVYIDQGCAYSITGNYKYKP